MKRFFLLASPLLLSAALLFLLLFAVPGQYDATYLAALRDKMALLSAPGSEPRVIVAGGSGAAFGQRSDLLEQALPGRKAVNFGLYGGLGTSPMLALSLPEIRPGDVVVLCPEQNAQTLSGYFGARAMWQAADGAPSLFFPLDGEKRRALLGEALPFAAEKFSFWRSGNAPAGDGVYARDHFNAWGDVLPQGREGNAMPGGFDPDMPITFSPSLLSPAFLREMNAFADACREKGAAVYYRFCPMNAAAIAPEEREGAAAYTAYLQSVLSFPVLGDAEDSILDSAWFFDTNFHLNAAGAVVNTARLARDLQAALGITGGVSFPLPDPPPPLVSSAGTAWNNRDAACFLYEKREGAAYLTGLTEAGAEREALIVPDALEGLPVTAFSPAVFAGNAVIKALTLPPTLRRIENDSFAGCVALEKITLGQENPGSVTVGPGLLNGTSAVVAVPAAAYSRYQTNYFWSVHASRLRPEEDAPPAAPAPAASPAPASGFMYADANGGEPLSGTETRVAFPISANHLRTNTPWGQQLFRREGFVPLCWNTASDGTGEDIPFGSRADSAEGAVLYLRWVPQTPEDQLQWEARDGEAWITGWTGTGPLLALPDTLGGLPVARILDGAFAGAALETAVLPPSLFSIAQNAFENSGVQSLWLYDSLFYVYDDSFRGCENLQSLHVSAATSPRYSVSYFGAFADKLDWLRLHADQPKILLAGGSASRYAYDSEALRAAFPSFTPVNMGVYAYTGMLPQYRIMERFAQPGDVLVSAPEFDTVRTQFCVSNALDERFWAMAEADYSCVSLLDLRQYSRVFSSLADYLHLRRMMTARNYEESPRFYDDDGNAVFSPTYNQYGDYTLPRAGGDRDELLQTYLAAYTPEAFPEATVEALNGVYREFQALGVKALFAYAPRNHSALTADSTPEARAALDRHLRAALCVPVILPIEDSLYPATLCYLIDNHLSDEGVRQHMARFLPALQAALNGP